MADLSNRRELLLPCEKNDDCPYEYDRDPERDIEGMPFIDDDPRRCPLYGHICPEFMEELGLTVEDLNIRAVIHCGMVMENSIKERQASNSRGNRKVVKRFHDIMKKYPPNEFPQYY